jgi:hypothetical protein
LEQAAVVLPTAITFSVDAPAGGDDLLVIDATSVISTDKSSINFESFVSNFILLLLLFLFLLDFCSSAGPLVVPLLLLRGYDATGGWAGSRRRRSTT